MKALQEEAFKESLLADKEKVRERHTHTETEEDRKRTMLSNYIL